MKEPSLSIGNAAFRICASRSRSSGGTGLPSRRVIPNPYQKLVRASALLWHRQLFQAEVMHDCNAPASRAVRAAVTLRYSTARKSDCVARLGGDEFAILLERADELSAWRMGLPVIEKVTGSALWVNGTWLRLSVAVGVSLIEAGDTPQSVMARADSAMYRVEAA